ncbi:hypothetical protein Ahy_B02g061057 [Arachis hypogaea]|uniref:TIR domain-containing protein n=1 Tax=Arachis hypogaea TaxID=3818 RepID=A0A445AK52_ARAHY|nr:hypothetical protein Ahy_B02g061057 [Arachis hypogaea]
MSSTASSSSQKKEPGLMKFTTSSYRNWTYDVYVSFDRTTNKFVSDLYARLSAAGVRVFKDEMEPRSGDQILFNAIEDSRISIVVFSRSYGDSKWWLKELEKIMECRSSKGQKVVPVFYGVDPSEAGAAFAYGEPLREAACLPGFVTYISRERDEALDNIVEHITAFLDGKDHWFTLPNVEKLQPRVQDLIQVQLLNYDKVLILGIWGMAGIGKTTIAMALYNQICYRFQRRMFVDNISERCEQHSIVSLQEELFSCICKTTEETKEEATKEAKEKATKETTEETTKAAVEEATEEATEEEREETTAEKAKIHDIESGKLLLKKNLSNKKTLLVLDDVTERDHLEALCGSREWFGPGSTIIITTRDRSMLKDADDIYTVKGMDYDESIELFCWHAFKNKEIPAEEYRELAESIVEYCGGVPLFLEVAGSHLYGKMIEEWEPALEELEENPPYKLQRFRQVSFDSLRDDSLKKIFLDIVCFFVGMNRNHVVKILNGTGRNGEKALSALEDKCLVTVDGNQLQMHTLIEEIGREIVDEESRLTPKLSTYDVFLSFRGKDTRAKFTSHLHAALENAGFYVFKDDVQLPRGEWISISLLEAVKDSRMSIIVLSTNYAGSKWCLEELENIMQLQRTTAHAVVPIFYGVDPSEVRHQSGVFGQKFNDLLRSHPVEEDKEKSWRTSLRQVGSLSGIVVVNSRNENEDIKKVVEDVTHLLDKTELFVADYPVGVTSRVQNVINLLMEQQSKDVLLLGICGMGGLGKTTIAKALYNQLSRKFDCKCFLLNIREVWEQDNGQVSLQDRLLSDIYKTTKIPIRSTESGKLELKNRLCHKRVLLVLDDIDKVEQMNALCGSHEWFGSGSCIIITTRDEHLVKMRGVEPIIYRLDEMDDSEAIELFSWHAFKQAYPDTNFSVLTKDVVAYSSGLPLALEVLGSYLCDREIEVWKNALEKLKRIPNHKIQEKLRISFDSLSDDTEKEIFLDIACFFIGMDRSDVIQILNDCGLFAEIGISVLRERSLVTVDSTNKLGMHNLLRDMGREIIREESPDEPEKRSRLWLHEEVLHVLTEYKGTTTITGLALKSPRTNPISLSTKAFEEMNKLRLLQLEKVQLDGDFKYISRDLRWMSWHGFPLSHIPKNCCQKGLVAIELEYGNLKIAWKQAQLLNKLKILNLSHSHQLRETPDFSYLPNLEKLILEDCSSLSSVSHTIGHLNQLLLINLKDCKSLRSLPRSIYKLKSLKTLILSGCLMIDKLEEDMEQMESLTTLKAEDTAITQVPNALVRMKNIGYISLCGFEGSVRDVLPSIIWSWTYPTNNVSSLFQNTLHHLSSMISKLPKRSSLLLESGLQLEIPEDVVLKTLDATNCKITNLDENASVDDITEDENVTVLDSDDMETDMNENVSDFEDMAVDRNAVVSDMLTDKSIDIISNGGESRISRFSRLRSLVHVVLKARLFWFGFIAILIWITCSYSENQECSTSFQVCQHTPTFKEAEVIPNKQVVKLLEEESKRKSKLSYSQRVVEPPPESKNIEASATIKNSRPKSKGDMPLVKTLFASNPKDDELALIADPTSLITTQEDNDLLAELEQILSESYVLSANKVTSATSVSELQSLPLIAVIQKVQLLLDNELEALVADNDIRKQLLDYLAHLVQMKSQVPTNIQKLVKEIKEFYEGFLGNFPPIQEVLDNHQRLIDTKNRLEEELEIAKAKQAHFSSSISKGKVRINEMSKEINELEVKLKALYDKRDKLKSTVKLCEVETMNINRKAVTWVKETEEVVSTLKASESSFKNAESSKHNYERKLSELKRALGKNKH